jgi:outer membrane protein OmpA-like peptidoglycan-associated protein
VSNPGDRWRNSWIVGAVALALLAAVTLGRCASTDSSDKTFTAASVQPDAARFAAELPSGAEVIILRGEVTSRTAKALRARANTLASETPGLQVDDQLTVSTKGVDLLEPEGLLVALAKGLMKPAALRVNSDFGAELTGVARSDEERTVTASIVSASLGDDAVIKNSVTVQAPTEEAEPADTVETVAPPSEEPIDTAPATTIATAETESTEVVVTEPPLDLAPPTTLPAPTTTEAPTLESNGTIALEGVQFDLGSARLTADSAVVLDRLVKTLNDNPELKIAISGHTDSSGDRGFNKTLSKARANSVLQYLTKAGIDSARLSAQGLGDSQPRADNSTSAGRKQNRRIEVTAQ